MDYSSWTCNGYLVRLVLNILHSKFSFVILEKSVQSVAASGVKDLIFFQMYCSLFFFLNVSYACLFIFPLIYILISIFSLLLHCPSPWKLFLETKAANSLKMPFWEHKSSPSHCVRNQVAEAGNQHDWTRSLWSNWEIRQTCTGSGIRDMRHSKNTRMLSRHAEMGWGKQR